MQEEKKELFCCADCSKEFEEKLTFENDNGDEICEKCYNENYYKCNHCGDIINSSDSRTDDEGNIICYNCYDDNYCTCENCGDTIHNDNARFNEGDECYYCERCYDDLDSEGFRTRDYHTGNTYTEPTKRFYSAEIECYYPNIDTMHTVYNEMNSDFGVSEDGSLNDDGVEFQTPKLSGEKGKQELKNLCKLLEDNDFTVDKTCGLHIHLDMSDYMDIERDFEERYNEDDEETEEYDKSFWKIKNLMIFYLNFESVMLSFLPRSRRKNKYCYPLIENYHEKEIKNLKFLEDLEVMWYREGTKENIERRKHHKYDDSRYSGINFHSMLSNNHLEVRYHSGTINSNKILKWAELHIYILNKIYNEEINYEKLQDIKYITELSEKTDTMFSLLKLPKETEDYFKERQAKFTGNAVDEK